jgi:hypothetical protein
MSPNHCYCGCHEGAPVKATTVDPDTANPVCLDCLIFAINEDGECVCSGQDDYSEGREGWSYHDARPARLEIVR